MFKKLNQWVKLIKNDVMTLWFAYQHPACPICSKFLVGFIILYALSPIDLIPDFIPVLGYLDEAIILPILVMLAIRLIPEKVLIIARAEAQIKAAGAGKVESYVSDLRDSSATEELIAKILAGGPVDILCNNAGIQHTAPTAEMPREKWNDIIAINLESFFDTMQIGRAHV